MATTPNIPLAQPAQADVEIDRPPTQARHRLQLERGDHAAGGPRQ